MIGLVGLMALLRQQKQISYVNRFFTKYRAKFPDLFSVNLVNPVEVPSNITSVKLVSLTSTLGTNFSTTKSYMADTPLIGTVHIVWIFLLVTILVFLAIFFAWIAYSHRTKPSVPVLIPLKDYTVNSTTSLVQIDDSVAL